PRPGSPHSLARRAIRTTLQQLLIDTCPEGHKNQGVGRLLKLPVLCAACICVSQLAWAQEAAPARALVPTPWMGAAHGPQYVQLFGTCSLEVTPTEAVIVGGVAVEALKP